MGDLNQLLPLVLTVYNEGNEVQLLMACNKLKKENSPSSASSALRRLVPVDRTAFSDVFRVVLSTRPPEMPFMWLFS